MKKTQPTLREFRKVVREIIKDIVKKDKILSECIGEDSWNNWNGKQPQFEDFVSQSTGTTGAYVSPSKGVIDTSNSAHVTSSSMPMKPPFDAKLTTAKDSLSEAGAKLVDKEQIYKGLRLRYQNNSGYVRSVNPRGFEFVGKNSPKPIFEPWKEFKKGGWYLIRESKASEMISESDKLINADDLEESEYGSYSGYSGAANNIADIEYNKNYILKRKSTGEYYEDGNISTPDTTMIRKHAKIVSGEWVKQIKYNIADTWQTILVKECQICSKTGGLIK